MELVYSHEDDADRERFVEYCREAGWKRIFSAGKLQIFETEDLDIPDINTDQEVKLKIINRKCLKDRVFFGISLLVLYILAFKMLINVGEGDYLDFENSGLLFMRVTLPIIIVIYSFLIVDYIIWYIGARKIVKSGGKPTYLKRPLTRLGDTGTIIFVVLSLVLGNLIDSIYSGDIFDAILLAVATVISLILIGVVPLYIANKNKNKESNGLQFGCITGLVIIAFMIISLSFGMSSGESWEEVDGVYQEVYNETLIVNMEDLGIETTRKHDRTRYKEGSPLLQVEYGYDDSTNGYSYKLYYTSYTTRFDWIYNTVLNERCLTNKEHDFKEVNDDAFGADKVYYSQGELDWLLLYKDKIVVIDTNIPFDTEQKEILGEKLSKT